MVMRTFFVRDRSHAAEAGGYVLFESDSHRYVAADKSTGRLCDSLTEAELFSSVEAAEAAALPGEKVAGGVLPGILGQSILRRGTPET